jgi:hypothetical protein
VIGFIVREIAGWLLVVLGLLAFYESWRMLWAAMIFETPPMVVIGFVIFRGGIHLLKVSVAARAAQKANRELEEAAKRPRLPLPRAAVARK